MSDLESDLEKETRDIKRDREVSERLDAVEAAARKLGSLELSEMPADLPAPRAFVKWVGGKSQILADLIKRVPKEWDPERDLYCEPFVGAGALFWKLAPRRAVLNDLCLDLVRTWRVVASGAIGQLVEKLRELQASYAADPEGTYYLVRDGKPPVHEGAADKAARMIFLNKAGFNGLYRVNSEGRFNVPWNKNPKSVVCDEPNLLACSRRMREIDLRICCQTFEEHIDMGSGPFVSSLRGALVYLDPPYFPMVRQGFTKYVPGGFRYDQQLLLISLAARMRDAGAHVLVSQAGDESIVEQYRRCGFRCEEVMAIRRVNSDGEGRGRVREYVMIGAPRRSSL